jgi:hypothetical protein
VADRRRKPGQLLRVNIPISVGLFGALALLVLAVTAAHVYLPTYRESIVFFSLAVTAAGTIGGTFYLGASLRMAAVQQRQAASFSVMARWNSPELFHSRAVCYKILEAFRLHGANGVSQELSEEKTALNVRHVLNFFEEMAIVVKAQHVDEDLLGDAFAGLVIRAYNALSAWIANHRNETGRPKIWAEFQWLFQRWQGR